MLVTPERTERIKTRIQAAVEGGLRDRKMSARRASLDVVGNDGLIRDIRAGRLPGVDRLEALFEYLGLEFYLGPRRQAAAAPGFAEAPAITALHQRDAERAGYVPVRWHDVSHRAGDPPMTPVAFSKRWLEAAGLDPANLAAVRQLDGASEHPKVALIDVTARQNGGPHLWCCRDGSGATLARIQFQTDVTVIFAETVAAPARILVGEDRGKVTLLGRVVWSGQLHGDGPAEV